MFRRALRLGRRRFRKWCVRGHTWCFQPQNLAACGLETSGTSGCCNPRLRPVGREGKSPCPPQRRPTDNNCGYSSTTSPNNTSSVGWLPVSGDALQQPENAVTIENDCAPKRGEKERPRRRGGERGTYETAQQSTSAERDQEHRHQSHPPRAPPIYGCAKIGGCSAARPASSFGFNCEALQRFC